MKESPNYQETIMSEQDRRALYEVRDAAQSLGSQMNYLHEVIQRLSQSMDQLSYEIAKMNEREAAAQTKEGSGT